MKVFNKVYSKMVVVAAMLCSLATVNAQETVTIDPITIAPGEEADVVVNYSSTVERSGATMTVILPEGLSFVKDDSGFSCKLGTSATATHIKTESYSNEDKQLKMAILDITKAPLSDGILLTMRVKADDALADKSEILFSKLKFNGGQNMDVVCEVTKGTATGINDLKVESKSGKSYNLGGQVVKGVKKGLIINNGKKIVQ